MVGVVHARYLDVLNARVGGFVDIVVFRSRNGNAVILLDGRGIVPAAGRVVDGGNRHGYDCGIGLAVLIGNRIAECIGSVDICRRCIENLAFGNDRHAFCRVCYRCNG